MMNAQRGYEYEAQRQYRRHFDVRPVVHPNKSKQDTEITAEDKKKLLQLLFLAGAVFLCIIVGIAYGAALNYTNNQLREENKALRSEVDALEIDIQGANNVAQIQKTAEGELGMAYPGNDEYVVLGASKEPAMAETVTGVVSNVEKDGAEQ